MDDLISKQEAISLPIKPKENRYFKTQSLDDAYEYGWHDLQGCIEKLPSAQPDNQTHLCDSCDYLYPDCPSEKDDVIFGNGIGNDNICACNKYKPFVQSERCSDCIVHGGDWECDHMHCRKGLLPSAQPELTDEDVKLIKQLRSYHNGSYAKVIDKLLATATAANITIGLVG